MWDAATGILLTETLKADTLIRSEKLFHSFLHSFRSLSPPPPPPPLFCSNCVTSICVCVWLFTRVVNSIDGW